MPTFNPLNYPIIFSEPRRKSNGTLAWQGHIPFAMFLIDLLRPRVFVELGTHKGVSYCAFCQAVDELQLSTKCYAVDTWRGDAHAGSYGDEVLADLKAHHDTLYSNFSTLIHSTFDEALARFPDASIDLLHIDGLHTYEAVKHDFQTWLPKMSERGVVLFHDSAVRDANFGVWKLWEEVKENRAHLEMFHSHGLGVLIIGSQESELKKLLAFPAERDAMRAFFAHQGNYLLNAQRDGERIEQFERVLRFFHLQLLFRVLTAWSEQGFANLSGRVFKPRKKPR